MIKYKVLNIERLDDKQIDAVYKDLLINKWHLVVIYSNKKSYVLTKEKSLLEINNVDNFLNVVNKDVFYHTMFNNTINKINSKDLNIYKYYIEKYREVMEKSLYGDKYLFGSIAVRTEDNSFITTIRGKENLEEFTIVEKVDHKKHIVYVNGKKATLNAPLLDTLFKNDKVKVIVHINHQYDYNLITYDYALPGTVRDSIRENKTSFNIENHGLFYLFDKEGNLL